MGRSAEHEHRFAGCLPPDDACYVNAAAELLRIGEYRLFELARQRQIGAKPTAPDLEPHFMRYLTTREVPAWARGFARAVVSAARKGDLDPRRFGLERAPASVLELRAFDLANLLIFAAATLSSWAIVQLAGPGL